MTQWLSVPQAAKVIGVDRTTFWRWVAAKQVEPAGTVNGRPVFDPQCIATLANQYRARKAA